MNEQNLEYLKDNLKYMGFGETLYKDLEKGMQSGVAAFQLTQASTVNNKPFEVTLNFRKSDQTDRYFFNSYHASLQHKNGEIKDQVFYLDNGKGVTAKEAYNLLEGRSVYKALSNKAGEPYHAWIQLDFSKKDVHNNHELRQFHEAYGYDLKASLSRYAMTDLDGGDREKALLQSLQKGNLQSVTIGNDVGVSKMFVEANPQYKGVTLYNSALKRVSKESLTEYLKPDGVKNKVDNLAPKKEVAEAPGQKNARNRSRGHSGSK